MDNLTILTSIYFLCSFLILFGGYRFLKKYNNSHKILLFLVLTGFLIAFPFITNVILFQISQYFKKDSISDTRILNTQEESATTTAILDTNLKVPPLYFGFTWGQLSSSSVFYDISKEPYVLGYDNAEFLDNNFVHGGIKIDGNNWVTDVDFNTNPNIQRQQNFYDYYDKELTKLGYTQRINLYSEKITLHGLSADGMLGGKLGYVLVKDGAVRVVILEHRLIPDEKTCKNDTTEPSGYSCEYGDAYRVFVSKPISLKEVLESFKKLKQEKI